jgi:transcriptional regulator with XRE-family HTH domain
MSDVQGHRRRRARTTEDAFDAEAESPDDKRLAVALGAKIRSERTRNGLTLQALASAVGVSPSLISQVERGAASPSITTLRKLAQALNVPMAALFLDPGDGPENGDSASEADIVVRQGRRKRMYAARSRVEYQLLTPDLGRQIEFLLGEFEPGSSAPPEPGTFVAHPGEENFLCLAGKVVMIVGQREFELGEGDSISFDCQIPHRLENRGDATARLVIAITPPSF